MAMKANPCLVKDPIGVETWLYLLRESTAAALYLPLTPADGRSGVCSIARVLRCHALTTSDVLPAAKGDHAINDMSSPCRIVVVSIVVGSGLAVGHDVPYRAPFLVQKTYFSVPKTNFWYRRPSFWYSEGGFWSLVSGLKRTLRSLYLLRGIASDLLECVVFTSYGFVSFVSEYTHLVSKYAL